MLARLRRAWAAFWAPPPWDWTVLYLVSGTDAARVKDGRWQLRVDGEWHDA